MEMQTTPGGEKHGMTRSIPNSVQAHNWENLKPAQQAEMKKKQKHAMELVEVEYINLTNQENGRFEAWYGASWPGEPIRKFVCLTGERYVIPRGLMEQVNDELGYHERTGLVKADGTELKADNPKKYQTHRFIYMGDAGK